MNKKWLSTCMAGLLAVTVISASLPALASHENQSIRVAYENYKVKLNNQRLSLKDGNGKTVSPFTYQDRLYLPLRAVSQAFGLTVAYDSATQTITLTSGASGNPGQPPSGTPPTGTPPTGTPPTGTPPTGTPPTGTPPTGTPPTGTPPALPSGEQPGQAPGQQDSSSGDETAAVNETKSIGIEYQDLKVILNGKTLTFTDEGGNALEPFVYNGTTFLPVRVLADALGLTVAYDDATKTVSLSGGSAQTQVEARGQYTTRGKTETLTGQSITATDADTAGVLVSNGGSLNLSGSVIHKASGDTSSEDNSNFYGINAGVLATSGSKAVLENTTITTSAEGANAVFATGAGSEITVSHVTIVTSGNSSRGLDATLTGTVRATDVNITTAGSHCAGLATDRGNGTIVVDGATIQTAGDGSPVIYSTGDIQANNLTGVATGSEAAVVEGKNTIVVRNSDLTGTLKHGVMLYQSFSGDAEVGTASFTMTDSTLTAKAGSLFYVTNTTANIHLNNVTLRGGDGTLLQTGADRWGTTGSNGGHITLNATHQILTGNVVADKLSTVTLNLTGNSSLSGTLNADRTASAVNVSLDADSHLTLTGNSYITALTDADGTLSNITGNGFNLYYDATAAANSWLNGQTFNLTGGGQLLPVSGN